MTCQLCDGRPDGGDTLLRLLVVNKVFASAPVGIAGAPQESKFFYNVDIKSRSDCGVEFVELCSGVAECHANSGRMPVSHLATSANGQLRLAHFNSLLTAQIIEQKNFSGWSPGRTCGMVMKWRKAVRVNSTAGPSCQWQVLWPGNAPD